MATELEALIALLEARNRIDAQIAAIIGRPAFVGHIGEWLAAHLFHIALDKRANAKGADGFFTDGPLIGQSINVKWYSQHDSLLDVNEQSIPDWFLVLTGAKGNAGASRGQHRPLQVKAVYLLNGPAVLGWLKAHNRKVGIASSLPSALWQAAEVYPQQICQSLLLLPEQRTILDLLGVL